MNRSFVPKRITSDKLWKEIFRVYVTLESKLIPNDSKNLIDTKRLVRVINTVDMMENRIYRGHKTNQI